MRAVEHLAAYATSYRYPTTAGRIKQSPDAATLDADINKVDAALVQAVSFFGVDLGKPGTPAARAHAIRRA